MSRTPSRRLRLAVETTKVAVVCAVGCLAVSPTLLPAQGVTAGAGAAPTPASPAAGTRVAALMERHDCSTTGLGPDVVPGSALVERDDRVQRVSFAVGWAVFTGDADGALVAVCAAPLADRGRPA